MKNGQVLDSGPVTTLGDPDSPLSDEFISEKFMANAVPVLGWEKSRLMHDAIIRNAHPLGAVQDLLGSAPPTS